MEPTSPSIIPVKLTLNGKHKHGNVLKKARKYVFALYNDHPSRDHYYHTYARVLELVGGCKELAAGTGLTDAEREILLLAAWFVDSEYVSTDREPKPTSTDIAQSFLKEYGYQGAKIEQIITCIKSVKGTQSPQSLLAEILNDGYWLYLAQRDYVQKSELLRTELEQLRGQNFTNEEWTTQCLDDFAKHPFYTEFAERKYGKSRIGNLLAVDHRLRKLVNSANTDHKYQDDNQLSFREIEDAFKLTSRNYVNLVGVADRKAGLLIHVSSIIISIVLAVLLRHLADNPMLLGPTILLLLVCSGTIAFAILASRPTHSANRSIASIDEPILFFGSFDKTDPAFERISWETYDNQIKQLRTNNKEALFNQMSGEVYQTRRLLSRKFRYLSYAYLTFLIGMVVTVLAYILAALIQNPAT